MNNERSTVTLKLVLHKGYVVIEFLGGVATAQSGHAQFEKYQKLLTFAAIGLFKIAYHISSHLYRNLKI